MATDPYTAIYQARRVAPRETPRGLSLVEQTIMDDRDEQLRTNVAESPAPDQVARQTRVAREAGIEPAMVEDVDGAERALTANRTVKVFGQYPALGRWAAANPRGAVTAQDDHESLGALGRAWEVLKGRGAQTVNMLGEQATAASAGISETLDAINYPFRAVAATIVAPFGLQDNPDADWNRRRALERTSREGFRAGAEVADKRAQTGSYWIDQTTSGLASVLPSLLGTAASIATRNPNYALAVMGGGVGAQTYQSARDKGLGVGSAATYAFTQGGTEALTERIPAIGLLGDLLKGTGFGKTIVRQLAEEIPGEQVATAVQDFSDWATLPENADKSFGDYLRARPAAAMQTVLATAGGTATQTSIAVATDRAVKAAVKVGGSVAQASQARQEARFFDRASKAAESSKLRVRDPEAFREAVKAQAEEAGTENIHVSGEAAREYMQSENYDPDSDPFHAYADQVEEAANTGGDVVIPIADALTDLAGSKAWEALKPDMRLTPGGQSPREADTFDAAMEDIMAEMTDAMAADEKAGQAGRDTRTKLTDALATKFQDAGLPVTQARQVAEFAAQRAATRAERKGWDIGGNEYDALSVKQVLPESAKPFVKRAGEAVTVDPELIKAIKAKRGPSLLDFIAKRGGINDPGGDLASMGIGKAKGVAKKGQRKLIRDYDPNAAVGSGQGDYGVDTVLRAAIDAGYFPDLTHLELEQGTSQLDTNVLIEAIDAELAGRPRYAKDAAGDVRAMLEQSGYDPAKMSAGDIRDALASMAEQDARDGLAQLPAMLDIGADAWDRTDMIASRLLHEAGIAGIKYLDGGSRSAGDGSYNYVVFDDSRVSIQAYEQSYDKDSRGRIIFDQGKAIIELFQSRNKSTLLHELGHLWLEELRFDAAQSDATPQLKADWQTVQDWFAANNHPMNPDGSIPVEAHELWARSHERYLMEGKSPVAALKRIFETFRGWLTGIYKTVDALKAPISPEIREVFDRLIATDEEIADASERQNLAALFKSAADQAMTAQEFEAYQRQVTDARAEAQGKLLDKTMRTVRAKATKAWNDEAATIREQVTADVNDLPLFRALRAMKTDRISEEWVKAEGFDTAALPVRVPPLTKPGASDPELIAEMAGFPTAGDMIRTLIEAESQQRQAKEGGDPRSMRVRVIETAVEAEMTRRHGDALNDGSIEREALEAVHNDMQGEVIATELRVLSRKSGKRATPYALAKDWARNRVRSGKVVDEASPAAIQRYARAASKAGKAAQDAMLKGDGDETFRQKQFQMLNNALVSEAKSAHDEVQAAVKRLGRVAKARTMKSVDQDYLEQAQALLESVDIRPRSQVGIDKQGSWEAWSAQRTAEGHDIVVPGSFEATLGKTNYTRLPVEDLLSLDEAVSQVMHLGRFKQTLLDNKERRDFEEVVLEAVLGMGGIDGPPPLGLEDPGWWAARKANVMGADAALLKMETVFDWLDGGNSEGVFNRMVFRPVSEAQHREADMLQDYHGRVKALFEAMPGDQVNRWTDKVTLPFTDPYTGQQARMTRQRIVAMALNIGNEGNLQRLSDGYGWNAQAIKEYLTGELTAEEWGFVQGVWDTIGALWPEIESMMRRVNGIAPDKIDPRSFTAPHGPMRGGYYPAIYDSTLDLKTEERRGREADLFEGAYTRASTNSSATKERANKVRRPILLDLGVINRHLGEVIHDITHREAVMQAHKFLTNETVASAIDTALGSEIRKQLRPWIKFVANSWALERAGNEGFGKWIGKLRANATAVGLGFRATTMVMQLAGLSNSTEVVGEVWMAKGVAHFAAHPVETHRFVMERSGEMRHRMDTLDRDIRTELARLAAKNPLSKGIARLDEGKAFMFHGIGLMDRAVSIPTWWAAYNKALSAGMDEEAAAYAGDKAVRVSQGAGAPKDLAAIQRGTGKWGEALKLFTMFYSYFSAQYQRQRTLTRDIRGVDSRRPRNMPRAAARAFWLLVVPPLLVEVMKASLGAGDPPEDDEWWVQWLSRKLLANSIGAIPVARDIFEPAWQSAIKGRFFNPAISPVQRLYDSIVKSAGDAGNLARGEDTKHATKDILETAGYVTGFVPGQLASATQFLVDVGNGDEDPQGFAQWVEGLTTGRIKENAD